MLKNYRTRTAPASEVEACASQQYAYACPACVTLSPPGQGGLKIGARTAVSARSWLQGLFKNKFRFCWRLFGCLARREVLPHGHPSIPASGL